MAREIDNWRELAGEDFQSLARAGESAYGHNVYVKGYGYVADHVPKGLRRNEPIDHWDAKFMGVNDVVDKELMEPRREAPLKLIANLAAQHLDEPCRVLHLSGGLGALSADISREVPNALVTHVDSSLQAATIAEKVIMFRGNPGRAIVINRTNLQVLSLMNTYKLRLDFGIAYGGVAENTPNLMVLEKTFGKMADILVPGGHILFVGAVQPRLLDPKDPTYNNDISDLPGEFPPPPGLVRTIMEYHGLYVVTAVTKPKTEDHQLIPHGPSVKHQHLFERILFAKPNPGGQVNTPEFSF